MTNIKNIFSLVLFLSLSAFLTGCVQSTPTARWVKNNKDAQVFETKTLLTDHTYYFIGSEVTPDSIIAIDNRYTLQTKVWSRVDITQKMLDDWMYWILVHPSISCPHVGGAILTPDGQKAGIWYSKKQVTLVKSPEPWVLQIYPPYNLAGTSCAGQERLDDK